MNRRDFLDLIGKGSISLALAPSFIVASKEWGYPGILEIEPKWQIEVFDWGRSFGIAGKWSDGKTYAMRFFQPKNEELIEAGKSALRAWYQEHA